MKIDGREITIDMSKITIKEYRTLFSPEQTAEEGDAVVGKTVGMTAEEIQALPQPDYRKLVAKFFEAAKAPIDEKN